MKLTVLGMGSMGRAVALRLLEQGHEVTVWNRTPGRAGEVADAGAREGASAGHAAMGADAVLVSLTDDKAVRSVILEGRAGTSLREVLEGGSGTVVEMSTVSPGTTRDVAAATGVGRMIAAPILGGPQAVRDGQAAYLLAGPRPLVDRLGPLWTSLSPTHRWVGEDPGIATTLKLLANYLLLAGLAALSEAVAAGQEAGVDDPTLRDFFSALPLVAPGLGNRLDDVVAGDHQGWFSARMGAKDAGLFTELARSAGLTLPLATLVEKRYGELGARGLGDADIAAVVELLRKP